MDPRGSFNAFIVLASCIADKFRLFLSNVLWTRSVVVDFPGINPVNVVEELEVPMLVARRLLNQVGRVHQYVMQMNATFLDVVKDKFLDVFRKRFPHFLLFLAHFGPSFSVNMQAGLWPVGLDLLRFTRKNSM